jgi:hypothetical protein
MDAKDYFSKIALPLYVRFVKEPNSDELRWAAIVAINHVADYEARDILSSSAKRKELSEKAAAIRNENEDVRKLGIIADAVKHAQKHSKDAVVARSETLRDSFLEIKDFLGEPDVFTARVIDVGGEPESIRPLLEKVVATIRKRYA